MKSHLYNILPVICFSLIAASCSDDIPMVSLGIDDSYRVARMQKLRLQSAFTGAQYRWTLHRNNMPDTVVSTTRDYIFLAADEGVYSLTFDVIDSDTPFSHDFTVNVMHEEIEYSPYIARVLEYCPAPGQFINEMPQWEEGDTYHDILQKAEDCISGKNEVMISLGAWGGYVTFAFDHTVINRPGYDFLIHGNAFYELTQPDKRGGSAEPGIVYVSYDTNCNGLPDDEWYQLAGSEYFNPLTRHNYTVTYHRPDPSREPVPDMTGFLNDIYYIPWEDSEGTIGYVAQNTFHDQNYFPRWVDGETLDFHGSRLPDNYADLSGMGTYYVLYSFDWGYADNHPNDYRDLNSFDISWAVDKTGRSVPLPGIDFVRVMTGLNQYCGWLGETSTEISGAIDLNIPTSPVIPDDPVID